MSLESLAALGAPLLSWMLRSAFLLAIALLAARLLEQRSAALRHALLTAGVIAALALPALTSLGVTAVLPASVVDVAQKLPNVSIEAPPRAPSGDVSSLLQTPAAESSDRRSVFIGGAVLIWLAVALVLALRSAVGLAAAARVRRRAAPVKDQVILTLLRQAAWQQQLNKLPELRASDRLSAPATLGCVRPTVLLPTAALSWPLERLRPVLAHELAHVARRDCTTTLLADLACIVYWCNPLAWLVARRQSMERERACDDRALASGVEPTQYGLLLLDVARSAYGRSAPFSVLMMARPRELESRLLAIVRGTEVERGQLSRRGIVVISLATLLLGVAAATRPAQATLAIVPDTLQLAQREPDRRGDSVAAPASERLPFSADAAALEARVRSSALWTGPDSLLVRHLVRHLTQISDAPQELGRDRAIWALSQARGNVLTEPLLEALGARDWRVQAYAAWTLGVARERHAVPALVQLIQHPVWRLRTMVAWALLEIGDASVLPAMTRALDDEAWQVRTSAVSFVAEHAGRDEGIRLLQPRLSDRHIAVRSTTADALATLSTRTP